MPAPGGYGGGAPAAAMQSLPESLGMDAMMEEAAAPKSRSRAMPARARGSVLGGVADAFRRAESDEDEGGAAFEEPMPPPTPELTAPEGFLDYAHLEMTGMTAAYARGRLMPMVDWDLRIVASMQIHVSTVVQIARAAREQAQQVEHLGVPPNHHVVDSLDSFDFRYDCAAPADVPSTGTWSTVAVATCEVGLQPELLCVPAVDPKVYRTLLVHNTSGRALLAGPVDVSAGDEFLLTAQLPAMAPGERAQRLGLGVEESVKVARRTQYKETTGGLLGGAAVLQHEIEVEINNRLPASSLVEVRERVPVPQDGEKDLKVEETDVRPAWEKIDEPIDGQQFVPGARRWRVTVPAGGRATLTARFNVRMPGDRMLVGGNRRV